MSAPHGPLEPRLRNFLKSFNRDSVEASTERLKTLLKLRQIRGSHDCAVATTHLLLHVIANSKEKDISNLLQRIRGVSRELEYAQRHEIVVGNIARRVLALAREIAEDGARSDLCKSGHARQDYSASLAPPRISPRDLPMHPSNCSIFSLIGQHESVTLPQSHRLEPHDGSSSLHGRAPLQKDKFNPKDDWMADILDGLREILEELDQEHKQIAGYALDHIHSDEIILIHSSSCIVQRFLLAAAKKQKFTVFYVESFGNEDLESLPFALGAGAAPHGDTHSGDSENSREIWKQLTAAGITVIPIELSGVFAIMSRVNKFILAPYSVLSNSALVASAGSQSICKAAKAHKTLVVVLCGVYRISHLFPTDVDQFCELGDPEEVVSYSDREFVESVIVVHPKSEYVPPEYVDIFITNIGSHPPSQIYRIVADHYRTEDMKL